MVKFAIVVLAALALSGCGTLLGKRSAPVKLTSNPAGAEVYVDGVRVGATPVEVAISSGGDHRVEFRLGGRSASCQLSGGVSGMWVAFDVAMGLLPLVVDAVTGGWHGLDYDGCHVRFPEQIAVK